MKHISLLLYSTIIFYQLVAEEGTPSEASSIFLGEIELTAPLSFYTNCWNPKQKTPLRLPGLRVHEKDLIVDLDKAIQESIEEQDLLRSQSSWLSDTNSGFPSIQTKDDVYEEVEAHEMQEWPDTR